ncbi:MAG TPA: fumarylacetoacetate hydrolase family protein [Thermoplasmataceae archaeon]|nr:fumarylacetoacetate hydrolase family protein [Thermoplasmataceae archaeon]
MRFAFVRVKNHTELAVATGEGLVPLNTITIKGLENVRITISSLMKNPYYIDLIDDALCEVNGELEYLREGEYKFDSAVGKPEKIICLGHNYKEHVGELKKKLPENPILFSKFNNSLAGHEEEIPLPENSSQIDYEGELGIVIGKAAYNVPEDKALDHVFGYFIANDVSARDLQFRTEQWLLGKTCEKFFPNGPFLVTSDEVRDPQNLSIKTRVNGEVRQNSNTSRMIFSCSRIISYISKYIPLKPGDVISTGTPEGVIVGMPAEKRKWLKNGDIVEVEIEKLGTLRNRFVS